MPVDAEAPLTRWERRTATPLLLVSLLFVLVLSMPIIRPDASSGERLGLRLIDVAIWAVFAVDYLVRLRLASHRRHFFRTHLPDLAIVLLPALRPLRLLRLLSLARVVAGRAKEALLGSVVRFVGGAAGLLVFVASVAVLNLERPAHGANITGFGDAVWWACTTITTVGYGDHYPVTAVGKVIAVALMVLGVALLGVLTAGIAAWLVQTVSREEGIEHDIRAEGRQLLEIRDRLVAIEARLTASDT